MCKSSKFAVIGRCTRWEAAGAAQHHPHSVHPWHSSAAPGGETTPPSPPVSHIDPCDPFNAPLVTLPCCCCCTRLESSLTISSINFNISSHLGWFLSLCGWAWVMYPIIQGVVTHLMNSVIWPLSWLIEELPHCSILNTYVLYILLSCFLNKVA